MEESSITARKKSIISTKFDFVRPGIMEGETIKWIWHPLFLVGSIKFGELAHPVIQKFKLRKLKRPFKEFYLDSYEFPDCETRIYTENSNINSVGCFDNIYYGDENLFGLTLDEIRNRLGQESEIGETIFFDFKDNKFEKTPIEFDDLSLQLWFRDGVVESAMVSGS
jgi:hypothetical protein